MGFLAVRRTTNLGLLATAGFVATLLACAVLRRWDRLRNSITKPTKSQNEQKTLSSQGDQAPKPRGDRTKSTMVAPTSDEREHGGKCPGCNNTFSRLVRHMKRCQAVAALNSEKGGLCPGCNSNFPNLMKHMRRCCPEHLQRSDDQEARADHRKAQSPDDWLESEEVAEAARKSFAAVADPLERQALELRFGLDQGGKRRSPAEVGEVLGGKYAKNPQTAQVLIRTAMNSIPLVADDPSGLEVIFEDDDLLAVAKPPFLRTNPVHRFCGKSLTNMLVGYLKPAGGSPPPYIIHRLDQCTSGVFLCTKTAKAAAALQSIWHGPDCVKEYLAIVHIRTQVAEFKEGYELEVDAPIGRESNLADDVKRIVDPAGQKAKTRFRFLACGRSVAIVSATLVESGRTHQIRVHASHSGLPLVGDGLYGGDDNIETAHINRVALHAWRLRVIHPQSNEKMQLTAPLPRDMSDCCRVHDVKWCD